MGRTLLPSVRPGALAGVDGAEELLQDHPDTRTADRDRFLAKIDEDAGG
ncbi:hypothetical protein FHS97_001529 [Sphingomonas endophytica]|uniref:Uncharacterized protein n=1 Tax=Sphingomonas endophytica TaxID=869719 RepID=A0ABR6N494_9SPHN|nr:hypothetical protein [Sphingomonas endophytica]MBB5725603.1 hypothetical protein [Sphingomonas endophytica]